MDKPLLELEVVQVHDGEVVVKVTDMNGQARQQVLREGSTVEVYGYVPSLEDRIRDAKPGQPVDVTGYSTEEVRDAMERVRGWKKVAPGLEVHEDFIRSLLGCYSCDKTDCPKHPSRRS